MLFSDFRPTGKPLRHKSLLLSEKENEESLDFTFTYRQCHLDAHDTRDMNDNLATEHSAKDPLRLLVTCFICLIFMFLPLLFLLRTHHWTPSFLHLALLLDVGLLYFSSFHCFTFHVSTQRVCIFLSFLDVNLSDAS